MAELYRSEICNVDIEKPLVRSYVGIVMATGDCLANRFGAVLRRDNEPVDVTGASVNGYFIRPNGDTVVCPGVAEGDTVYVDLPAACYTQNGNFSLAIKVSSTDVTQTVRVVDGYIRQTQTETLIDPGEVVPSLDQLLAHIAEMEAIVDQAQEIVDTAKTEVLSASAPSIDVNTSGDSVTITDGAERPAKSIVSIIEAVQSGEGDPSPDNVRPIIGIGSVNVNREGKNLFDLNAVESWPISDDSTDKRYGVKSMYRSGRYTISCKVNPGGTYIYAKIVKADGSLGDNMYLVLQSAVNKYTIDLAENEGLLVYNAAGGTTKESTINVFTAAKIQIETGDTETGYEPYQQGVALTADLQQTVYGGSFNWTTGVLTLTHVGKALRAADISYKSTSVSVNTSCFVTKADASIAVGSLTSMCSHFKNTLDSAYKAASARHGIFSDHATQTTKYFNWGEPDATVTDFGNWLEEQYAAGTPVTVVYLLKEPYTIQLTPQQLDLWKGYNYIWSDTGDMDFAYIADTKLYIDNKFTALQNAILAQGVNI